MFPVFNNIHGLRALYRDYHDDFDNPVFQNSPLYLRIVNSNVFNARGIFHDEISSDLSVFLAKIIARSTSITKVDLGDNNLGKNAILVTHELAKCSSLTSVALSFNNLGGHESEVARELVKCKTLVYAYISDP